MLCLIGDCDMVTCYRRVNVEECVDYEVGVSFLEVDVKEFGMRY